MEYKRKTQQEYQRDYYLKNKDKGEQANIRISKRVLFKNRDVILFIRGQYFRNKVKKHYKNK